MDGSKSERVRLREGAVEWREVEQEVVAIDLKREVYIAVNPTGAALWPSLAEGTTTDALVARLQEAFEVDESTASADVASFLDALEEQGLLERQPQE